ncbi:hypothetical protein Pfo_012258 [Paulownia fortunei]|nr:hypothetical protein Pfo_012258 [Paulownia fortunei]
MGYPGLENGSIAANRIFRLEPKFGRLELPENEQLDEAKEEVTMEEKADKFRNLTVMYSTKKDIRRGKRKAEGYSNLKKYSLIGITVQDVKRETLRQTERPGMQEDMEAIASTTNARIVPPYDLAATSPDMAYPLDKIILKGEVKKLEDVKDESEKRRIAGILFYITHLTKFKDRHSMDGVSSAKHHKLPSILSQKFSSMFGATNDTRIPDEKQKLLISYILVLSLFADDFRPDPSDIAKDLRMSPIMLRPHYKYLGCKFVRDNQVLLATLPVPLEFQTIKRKRRR